MGDKLCWLSVARTVPAGTRTPTPDLVVKHDIEATLAQHDALVELGWPPQRGKEGR